MCLLFKLATLILLTHYCRAGPREPKVYLFPLFEEQDGQSFVNITADFVEGCRRANSKHLYRLEIDFVPLNSFQRAICYLGPNGDCDQFSVETDEVVLKPDTYIGYRENLQKLLDADSTREIDDSIGVFLTNVPCGDFDKYPDIQTLFGTGFNETVKLFNSRFFLHTGIYWLSHDPTDSTTLECPSLKNYEFENSTDFLHLYELKYDKIISAGSICSTIFPNIRDIKRYSIKKKSTRTWMIIVFSIICVALLGGIIGVVCAICFHFRKIDRRNNANR